MTVNMVEVDEDRTTTTIQVMISKAPPITVEKNMEIEETTEDRAITVIGETTAETTAEMMITLADVTTTMEAEAKAAMAVVTKVVTVAEIREAMAVEMTDEMTEETMGTVDVKSRDKTMAMVRKDADPSKADDMKVEAIPMVADKNIKEAEAISNLRVLSRVDLATEAVDRVRVTETHMEVAAGAVAMIKNSVKLHNMLRATVLRTLTYSLLQCLS